MKGPRDATPSAGVEESRSEGAASPPTQTDKLDLRPDRTIRLSSAQLRDRLSQRERLGCLVVIEGTPADLGKHAVVKDTVVVGRSPRGLCLRDGNISWRHAAVRAEGISHIVADLGSTNGTLLNGAPVEGEAAISEGDSMVLGQTVLRFRLVDETEASYHQEVDRLVGTDALTGLVAKHRFDAHLQHALALARSSSIPLVVMMMDMDGVKAINTAHGHHVGASTIAQVGHLLGRIFDGRGEATRFGGDEFCAFLPNNRLPQARAVADQIRAEVAQSTFTCGEVTVRVTLSIGLAEFDPTGPAVDTPVALVARADQALYRAKNDGKNRISS